MHSSGSHVRVYCKYKSILRNERTYHYDDTSRKARMLEEHERKNDEDICGERISNK